MECTSHMKVVLVPCVAGVLAGLTAWVGCHCQCYISACSRAVEFPSYSYRLHVTSKGPHSFHDHFEIN